MLSNTTWRSVNYCVDVVITVHQAELPLQLAAASSLGAQGPKLSVKGL